MAYLKMYQQLKDHFQVHSLDTFGMGLSSRGNWSDNMQKEEVIAYYIDAIEEWRKNIGI